MKLQVINNSGYPLQRATSGAAGIDLVCSYVEYTGTGEVTAHTNVYVAIPTGYVGLLIARSSLHKRGWRMANSVGVIDSDYRGEILVKLEPITTVEESMALYGDSRIAQLVIVPCPVMEIEEVSVLPETERGAGGFGSTGK